MSEKITVLIVDDHAVVREGIQRALEQRGGFEIHVAASKAEAIAQVSTRNPSLIYIDINLGDGNGLELVSWVRRISETVSIIVLSLHEEDEYVLAAMKAGASAYVSKAQPLSVLLDFTDHALRAPTSFTAQSLSQIMIRSTETFGLSQRELQIVSQLDNGDSLRDLARNMFIAESTLKKHLSAIYRKLEVSNRVQAIKKARTAGLLK